MSVSQQQLSKKDEKAYELENNEQLVSVLRFLIADNAFSTDFLITTIMEYLADDKNIK